MTKTVQESKAADVARQPIVHAAALGAAELDKVAGAGAEWEPPRRN
jgi:hypothetical protein